MIIKKYIVNDMKEAITMAKYELGKDAVILTQREIKEGKWYMPFKKTKLEVTMAIEEKRDLPQSQPLLDLEKNEKAEVKIREAKKIDTVNLQQGDGIENSKLFNRVNKSFEEKLRGYINIKGIKEDLSLEEIEEFMNIAFKGNCIEKKLPLNKINVFIGPTGSGKTTTIAKIAAKEYLENNKKVGLITLDTYKIGAVEQIKTYGEILGLPLEVVENPNDMLKAIEGMKDCDLILVDTLGTSQKNQEKIDDIKRYIDIIKEPKNIYLVFSISIDEEVMFSIMDKYQKLNYQSLILTKFDEMANYKNIWNLVEKSIYPIQYFCLGQEVPEDIKEANLRNILEYSEEI